MRNHQGYFWTTYNERGEFFEDNSLGKVSDRHILRFIAEWSGNEDDPQYWVPNLA